MKEILIKTLVLWLAVLLIYITFGVIVAVPILLNAYFGYTPWIIILDCIWITFWSSLISVLISELRRNM